MRRIATFVLLLFVVLFGAYTVLWFYIANRMTGEITQWAEHERQHRLDVSWEALRVGGYPLEFRITANGLQVRDLMPGRAASLQAPLIRASAYPWNFRSWAVDAPSGLTAGTGPADSPRTKLTADSAAGDILLDAERDIAVTLDLDQPVFEGGERVAARDAVISATVPQEPPTDHDEPALSLSVEAHDLQLPKVPAPFRGTVDELSFDLTVLGPVPNLPPRQAAASWRDTGGTIEVEKIAARAGDLAIAGSGTFALDRELQPEAAFSGSVQGYDKLITGLTEAGILPSGGSAVARLGLSLLARPGANGQSQIKTSFTMQNGEMALGPLKLGAAPRIDWD